MHLSPLSRLVASSCEGRTGEVDNETGEVDNEKKVSSIPLLPRLVSDLHRFFRLLALTVHLNSIILYTITIDNGYSSTRHEAQVR